MYKKIFFSFLCFLVIVSASAQLKSPSEFLGYSIGTKFTPHWKVVNYFHHVASQATAMVKLEQYGETNEGRPLLLAFISDPQNINRLDQIRMNNLRLANVAKDKAMPMEDNAPAIVWLSYNVHGNETSSSEAAMLTLYSLVEPSNAQTKEWLKNTVVIIDPCLNPDGRDRYVNWFNSIEGIKANPQPMAREHRELWPGGRTNHYNFDLNRDWAWQTQVESQQRIKIYDQWLPQVHVDYHEQWVDAPYYFAPAAEPFHEVITSWQREFQTMIGKNNAKYFDKNGWLYYTKELFDLFYPSYGDTYPTYNGAIGMTYEQAGHGISGTAIINNEGDTLTLHDRVMHHYTTGISTVETASLNATRLVKEFRKYFNEAVSTGVGEYKSYVIKNNPADAERIKALIQLFDKNDIRYGLTNAGTGKGFSYQSGKEEVFNYGKDDIIVSALQPRSSLVKVLLEPKSKLTDSATYDISAWSLPYAYGLTAWATKEKINGAGSFSTSNVQNAETTYGYLMEWNGVSAAKTAGQLLQKGILLRYAEQPFQIDGKQYERGTIIILKTANKSFGDNLWKIVREVADGNRIKLNPVSGGLVDKGFDFGSSKVHPFKAPKVVLLTGEGVNANAAGEIWHFCDQQLGYPITLVNANDISRANWNDFNVLILPDGNYRFLNDKSFVESFKEWVQKGGRVIALENAVAQLAKADFGIKQKKDDEEKKDSSSSYDDLKKFADRERDAISGFTPGSILKVELDNTHPLGFGYPGYYYTLKLDDNFYEYFKNDGWNVGIIRKDNQVAGFIGAEKKQKFRDGLLFGAQAMGDGTVIYMADNPLFRSFWENGKLLLCNALFFSGQ
ncbi:MAG TPA: M14 family metallopeptidase [Chitinophagaceae bacterium]|nr:M14 family metallopeptidase [Chitinophagaceae bacterium]